MKQKIFLLILVLLILAAGYLLIQQFKKEKVTPVADREAVFHHRNLGLAYLEESRLQEAEKNFRELIRVAPDEAIGYSNLALVYLRSGKYPEAEEQAKKGLEKSPDNPDAALIVAEVYEQSNKISEAITLMEKTVSAHPDHVRSRYKLSQLLLRDSADPSRALLHLEKLSEQQPGNIAVQLQFLEVLIRAGRPEEAIKLLQLLRQQLPELEGPANELLQNTLNALHQNPQEAITPSVMFHNVLKPTAYYRAGITELKGPGAPIIGFPLLFFDSKFQQQALAGQSIPVSFEDAGVHLAPHGALATGDYDSDGDPDLFAGGHLFENERGKFSEVQKLGSEKQSTFAAFADYDNDGDLDLYHAGSDFQMVHKNNGSGNWQDVTKSLGLPETSGALRTLIFDFDQDGDLDFFKIGYAKNAAYRNNGDGTFTERAEQMGLSGANQIDGAFFDFDEDGDLDLIVSGEQSIKLYSNLREGRFQDVTPPDLKPAVTLAVGDDNNEAPLDIFAGSLFYRNQNSKFTPETSSSRGVNISANIKKAAFADFDNDGYLDLFIAAPTPRLFRNKGAAQYQDQSTILPKNLPEIEDWAISDIDSDGDLDLLISDAANGTKLLKNSGGNANRWLKVNLKGLGTGSGKNNRYAIGASVEVLTGELYQKRVVNEPVTHFGLNTHSTTDVVRVVWTNGVPQNRVLAQANQTIVEEQILKGSCAFLYAWNGTRYEFVTDVLWRSALGMPLGIMGNSTTYAFADASREYVKIGSKQLQPKDGKLSLRITEELWETPYLDEVTLIAIDHPSDSDIFVDEKFIPPPFPPLHIYKVTEKIVPRTAVNESGEDLSRYIRQKDDSYTPNYIPAKFQGITSMHDLILDPGTELKSDRLLLFLNGWIFPSDASINTGLSQGKSERAAAPYIEVLDQYGKWKQVATVGFPGGKDKTVVVDLSGKMNGASKIRIRSSMEVYWDQIFFAEDQTTQATQTPMKAISSELRYRGFSRLYRKGLYGPHWFDYNSVRQEPLWRDLEGNYTKFGDVNSLLTDSDSKYVIFNAGDEIAMEFDAASLPKLPEGWTRDYLIYTVGWLKDGDFNTATSNTVEPLPFHGMTRYPYGPEQTYPQDADHQEYLRKYNTRRVEHKLPRVDPNWSGQSQEQSKPK
jgi:tetratricopeptide (TPR) repeat protein